MLRVGLVFGIVYYLIGRFVLEAWAKTAEVDEKWGSETRFTELTFAPEAAPMGIDLAFTAGYSWADYPDYTVVLPVPGGRQDETGYLRAEAVLKDFGYGGFAPVLSINLSQTDSNVSRFTNTEQGFGLTMRSTF